MSEKYILFISTDSLVSFQQMLAVVVSLLEKRLGMCFMDVEWDAEYIQKAMTMLMNRCIAERLKDEADLYLTECMQRLEDVTVVIEAINNKLRGGINATFVQHMDIGEMWKYVGSSAKPWRDGHALYVMEVVELFRKISEMMTGDGQLEELPNSVVLKRVWMDCTSKAKLVLSKKAVAEEPQFLPFMLALVWMALSRQFNRVPMVLVEVHFLMLKLRCL